MEHLFHFENINFQGKAYYMHWYYRTKRNVQLGLVLGRHFILLQNRCGVDLVDLDNLNCPIKRQVVQHLHTSRNLQITWMCWEEKEFNKKPFLKVKASLSNIHNCKLCSFRTLQKYMQDE
jgi:hypothetical protein